MRSADDSLANINIPGFSIKRVLGRGGMAQVFLAVQESIGREVALKVMLPQLLTDKSFSDRFLREAQISAKLAHPNIVSIYDVGVSHDLHYIAMEFHPGGDLKDKVKKGLSSTEAIHVIIEIASALDFANKKGFVHRDIKPENILFSQTGAAVLSDFGIARAADANTQLTATGSIIGTPHYMSPEQAQGMKVDGRSDLYSLGVVFYQLLAGRVPFQGDSAMSIGIKHIRDPIPPLPKLSAKYQTFLEKLLAKDPEERWQTGADVVRTLQVLAMESSADGDATLQATAVMASNTIARSRLVNDANAARKSKTGLLPGIGLAVAALVGGYLYLAQNRSSLITTSTPAVGVVTAAPKVESTAPQPLAVAKPGEATQLVAEPKETRKREIAGSRIASRKKAAAEKIQQEVRQKLELYVERANAYLDPVRLSDVRVEKSYENYQTAKSLSPQDRAVLGLPLKIANAYQVLADDMRAQKQWEASRKLANKGLAVFPDHRELVKFVARIESEKKSANAEKVKPRRAFGGF